VVVIIKFEVDSAVHCRLVMLSLLTIAWPLDLDIWSGKVLCITHYVTWSTVSPILSHLWLSVLYDGLSLTALLIPVMGKVYILSCDLWEAGEKQWTPDLHFSAHCSTFIFNVITVSFCGIYRICLCCIILFMQTLRSKIEKKFSFSGFVVEL